MTAELIPDPARRQALEAAIHAESYMCWTCGSCVTECPVNIATNRLRPRKIVRLANLGLMDELLHLPEIWYCQTCNRCSQVCPMTVKPADIILHLRYENEHMGLFPYATIRRYKQMYGQFQRVRSHMAARCLEGETEMTEAEWRRWFDTQVPTSAHPLTLQSRTATVSTFRKAAVQQNNTAACFTCSKCSSACPVFFERGAFDPMWIVRMLNLGMVEQLLSQPEIWLCIACGRCSDGCSQGVKVDRMIDQLQKQALASGQIAADFMLRFQSLHTALFGRFLQEVDRLFGFRNN